MNKSIKLERKNIQDILALTPMQEGLLFHYLQAPQEDSYLNQLDLEVSGDINLRYFKEAWNYVIESNEMLRTVFRWEKLETPFQVVLKRHTLHWTFEDLSIVGDGEEQKRQWNMVKQQDRGSQFDLRQVPFRVILGKMSQYRYHMLISNHHILYDGWSTGIILKEFLLAYEVLAVGNQPLVPRVKSRFKEFIQWHREQDRREQKKFWQNYLEGFDTPTRLPIKRLKQSPGSPGERNYRLHLCRTVKDKLEVLVKEKRITLAAFFYCAWGVLLQKYGDMEDVVFGTTVSGRSAPIKGIEDMVGLFINTIPLRVGFDPDESLMDFLVRINNHLAAGEKYEYTSLVDIYRDCRQSMQVKEELFDTLVSIENYPLDTYLKVPGSHLSVQSYEMEERPHYDLTLVISAAEEIDIDFIYNNTCLDKKTIVRLAHHFSTILKGIIENVGYRPQEIEILSGEEKHQLLVDFNRTAADYPKEMTIYGLFEEQVERAPDHIALVGAALDNCPAFPVRPVRLVRPVRPVRQIQLTYHELNEQSNRLAGWLIGKGVQPDTIVGIMMERSVELIVSIMGILKAGAAYLPIDPDYPQERIDYMLKDSSARILLKKSEIRNPKSETNPNDQNLNDKNSTSTCLVLNFEHLKFEFLIGRPRRGLSNFEIRASNLSSSKLAYVIYTSGTTGKPKGVGIEHRSVINFIKGITDIIPFTENDRILSLTTISFDIFGLETLVPLTNGSTIVMGGREEQLNPEAVGIILERERISIFQTTPSRLGIIIDSPGGILSLKKVNFLLVGGEVFSKLLLEKTKPLVKGRIFNMYGPTETTIWSTVKELSAREALNIGKPIANTLIYILDNLGKLQPIELVGELCIGGDGLARGYLNNPELTRERFIFYRSYRSYMTYISKKIYKTGDLARWLPDGNIEFLGRIDHQVKIRGSRIELGEIESRLNSHPGIKTTAAVVKTDNSGDNYLCAYIVSDNELPASGLNDYLSKYLPGYMVPSYFVRMEKMPLTSSGKVDRRALPEPGFRIDESYTAPRDEIEKKLVEIWSGVLGIEKEKIGINGNFFHLGGHSLKAMLLASRIHKELKVNVPLPEIFKTSHIRGLARYIENSAGDKYAPIEALEKKEYYSLSSAQKRLYFLQQMDPDSTAYNMPIAFSLGKEANIAGIETALGKLIARHESLRTSFQKPGDEPVQRIWDNVVFELSASDDERFGEVPGLGGALVGAAPRARGPQLETNIIKTFVRPFDLSRAPLIRLTVIKEVDGGYTWLVDMHHIISDGTSSIIMREDFLSLAAGEDMPPLRVQYKDFSRWQNRLFSTGKIKAQEDYWLGVYRDAAEIPHLDIPADYKRPGVFTYAGDSFEFVLEGVDAVKFKTLATGDSGTLYMKILAVLNTLFHLYTGQTDIIIGTGTAGRPHADLQHIMGMFVNTLAMRNNPRGDITFETFLKEVIAKSIDAFENQDMQFEELVDRLNLERDPSGNPLFDIMMVVQNFQRTDNNAANNQGLAQIGIVPVLEKNSSAIALKQPSSKFDMTFFVQEEGDNISIVMEYYTGIFARETIARYARHFKQLIKTVTANPGIKLSGIEILTDHEKQEVLYGFNETRADYPHEKTICDLFTLQVEKTPDKIAVIGPQSRAELETPGSGEAGKRISTPPVTGSITYKELDQGSNRLANYLLHEKHLQPEDRVGVFMDKSIERIMSVLGVLKAGGAFVPIDPSLPVERIESIIADSQIRVVISMKRLLRTLNRLQWECPGLHTFLCIDSWEIDREDEEEKSELMDESLWKFVAETAVDDITAGGWLSSYTNEPLTRAEMDEYGDNILEKLTPLLHQDMRALEIGCASGISMSRIAPKVGLYYGTDLSNTIIQKNIQRVKEEGHRNIKLECLPAHEIDKIREKDFDLVIINSVIQCFPGLNYLRKVLNKAMALMNHRGYIFIGDVMDQELKKDLIDDLETFKRADHDKKYTTKTDFSTELFVAKDFFADLSQEMPWIQAVETSMKTGTIANELTRFRYDVLITIDKSNPGGNTLGSREKQKYRQDLRALHVWDDRPVTTRIDPRQIAYIIYTSGSTGRPKGVMIRDESLVNLCSWHNRCYQVTENDNATQFAGFGFDASVWEVFPYLVKGAVVHIIPDETGLETGRLNEYFESRFITIAFLPTQLCELFTKEENHSLRALLTGGDKLRTFEPRTYTLYNNYGPTENTVVTTSCPVMGEYLNIGSIPIGKPIANTCVYIINPSYHAGSTHSPFKLQPIGVTGELCISGIGLARGYLNDPGLTAEKFCLRRPGGLFSTKGDRCRLQVQVKLSKTSSATKPSLIGPPCHGAPWTPRKNFLLDHSTYSTIYRTGDLARWLSDGNIEFIGRVDLQVKIRGFRIELGEIEDCLSRAGGVKDAVVLAREEVGGDKYICAYFVTDLEYGISELREYLSMELPDYMIPSYFVRLEKIPLTPNGKVDRRALPNPVGISLRQNVGCTLPSGAVEKKLVEIWEKVLGRDNIGINENFFMIGGDSIKSIQIISRMGSAGYKLEMKDLFLYPMISNLAPRVKKLKRIPDRSTITGTIPLTPIQRRFFHEYHIDPHHYNQAVMLYSRKGFDKKTLEKVFSKIQEHHDALRMTYKFNAGKREVVQIAHDLNYPLSIQEYDLRNREDRLDEFKAKLNQVQASIDLEKGPLMKLGLFHLEDGDRLLIALHHLVIDGVSWRILFEDIETLYNQYKRGDKLALPSKTDSFKTWSEQLSEYANSKTFLKEKTYWQKIDSIEAASIPKDFDVDENYIKDTVNVSFTLEEEETKSLLTRVNKTFRTEINDILITALGMGIKETWGHNRVLIALEGHGRENIFEDIDISRTAGWFTILYPLLLDISFSSEPGRQIKEIKETLRLIPNKGIGYGILKYLTDEENKKEIEFKLKPQIGFNYLGQFDADIRETSSFEIAGESPGNTHSLNNQREYLIDINGMTTNNRLTMTISYNRTHFKPGTAAALSGNFESALRNLIAFCCSKEKTEPTPADFTDKKLSIESVDRLMESYPGIEDIHTLTPMQEGMLYHALADGSSHSYFEQISYRLEEELDISIVEISLKELFKRHDILRTVFVYHDIERPVQVVLKERAIEFYYEDLSKIDGHEEKENYTRDFKTKDRERPFDLSKGPLMRVSILRIDNGANEFVWSFHHILMDGWCVGILNKDFFQVYRGIKENRTIELPAVKPYRDYIRWLEQRDREAAREYWDEYLAGYEESSGIPRLLNGKIKEKGGYRDEKVNVVLDPGKIEGLKKTGKKRGVTLNIIMQGVWGILLGRYTGKEDVVFGSVVSGRPPEIEGIEAMVGLFINTVPVRVRYWGDMQFGKLLEKLQRSALESEPHHYYPLAEIQAGSLLKQDLIDHIYIFENYPIVEQIEGYETPGTGARHADETSELRLSQVETFEQTNYDFNVVLGGSDRLMIELAYNGNIFQKEFVYRIGGHLRQIIRQVIESDDKKINEIDIITDEEKEQVLYRFNDTQKDYPRTKTIHELFEEQVERTPDHVALCGQGAFLKRFFIGSPRRGALDPQKTFYCLTYYELNEQSNRLACTLLEKGAQPDTIVGIMIERSVDMIIGILGILKSGGAYLPIDPDYPQERIDYMLKDSGAKILLTGKEIAGLYLPQALYLSEGHHPNFPASQLPSFPASLFSSLAYVIYTSGTTGKPKGVLVEHRNAVNVINWNADMHKVGTGTFILLVSDYTFDASVGQIFEALIPGAILYIVDKEIRLDTEKLRHYIINHTINLIDLVPTHLKELLCYTDKLESLHTIISGGEKLDDATKEIIIEKGYRLVNQYGPTETTVDALALDCSWEKVSMGKPISNVKVYILDRYEKVLPLGVVGELHIAGAGVARGYLNRPGLTQEKFLFYRSYRSYRTYIKLYKTGDLARWQEDGNIEFLGRIDYQVKIRGFRIELGEIENRLLTHDKVKEAIVIAREDHNNDKYLCAYIAAKPGETNPIDSSGLREYLSHRLPGYMIPAYFVQLDNLPLASNGKVDRKALPEPEMKPGENYIAPRNQTEKKLAGIWSDILDVEKEKIGIDDNFFHLGGHSLKATLLVSRIHKELKVSVPLSEVFKTSHIRGLAALVKSAVQDKYTKIEAIETREYYPVFSAQKRVYLSHQIDRSKVGYNLIHAVPLGKKIEIDKLQSSLKKLVDRHESLRTSFELVQGKIVQRVHRDLSFEIEHIRLNMSMDNPGASPLQAEELPVDFMRPFDLSEPPLFRIGLVETGKGEHILIIGIHHIITDGRSLEILTEEFISLYTEKELFPLRLQFRDFSNWYNSPRQKISIKEQEESWTGQFRDKITLLNLPTDFERPPVLTSEGDTVGFNLDSQITGELGKIQIETNTTMFMVLIAIYSVFLAKIANQEDILVGIPIAGRRHTDLQQITGMFVNTLVMRSQPTKDKSFREFLSQMKEYALNAFENQEYQFENLVELVAKKRDAGRNPIFDTMFSYQEIDKKEIEDIESMTGQYDHKYKTSLFDLSLVVIDQKDTLKCIFFYNLNLFKKDTVLKWVRYFQAAIDSIVDQPGIKLGEIDILPQEEKQRFLEKIDHEEEGAGKEEYCVEPATEKERKILALWEKILSEKPPGVTADFFQAGGSSIEALLLVTEINKTFKRKLSITDIYENENIRKQAALVEQTPEPDKGEKSAKDKNIFRLKVGSRGSKNIFLIHDATGEVDKYRLFCKELKSRDNYWGLPLKSAAVGGLAPQELEIESLASGYLSTIKQVQPRGPYYLGGWSIGGLIAFEITRQLEQAGEDVDRLYMFDTAVPGKKTPSQPFNLSEELESINRYFQVPVTVFDGFKASNIEGLWQEFLDFVENNETYNQGYIVEKLSEYSELISDFDKLPAAELIKYVNRFRSASSAGLNYFPGTKIRAKLQYYQAESSELDPTKWQDFFTDKIDLYQTRGNHFNMFNGPNLKYLLGIFQEHTPPFGHPSQEGN